MTETRRALEPCPFCGGPASLSSRSWDERSGYQRDAIVACADCGANIVVRSKMDAAGWADEPQDDQDARAITKWNTRAALQSVPDGGEGYVLVPREPTAAMLEAALDESGWRVEPYTAPRESGVAIDSDMSEADAKEINEAGRAAHRDTYRAMLAAAPPPDGSQQRAAVIAEMRAIAAGEYEGADEVLDEWTSDNRAIIDDWQVRLSSCAPDGSQSADCIQQEFTSLLRYCHDANAGRQPADAREFTRRVQMVEEKVMGLLPKVWSCPAFKAGHIDSLDECYWPSCKAAPPDGSPAGWWLAPDEPTSDMAKRFYANPDATFRECYRAMRAAAATPPVAPQGLSTQEGVT